MSTTPRPGGSVVASMRTMDGNKGALRMEDIFDTDIDDLWSALTDPDRLARWIATVEGDLRVGGYVQARFTSSVDWPVRIDVCDAPSRLLVTTRPGTSDEKVIEAALTSVGDQTRLVIEQRGDPLDDLPLHGAGWQVHFEDLAFHLAGRAPNNFPARWIELTPAYQALAEAQR